MKFITVLTLISQVLSIPIISPYDVNGCCISCGYTYCDTLLECIRPWEVECPKLINPFINKNILDINNEVGSI
jgi:hypothetical protein